MVGAGLSAAPRRAVGSEGGSEGGSGNRGGGGVGG